MSTTNVSPKATVGDQNSGDAKNGPSKTTEVSNAVAQSPFKNIGNASKSSSNSDKTKRDHQSIQVLPQEVVDLIAAGEVVQRPASVIKELIENSLDAGSTHIVVHVEKGGLSKLSISDNGSGISKSDMTLAATRHATSKFEKIDDFAHLRTFGFRGEALSSISMCAKLTITTRTRESTVGFTQTYRNGEPTSNTGSKSKNPKPCARKQGTTITVQDLFHNIPYRLKTFSKREADEYNRILTIVQYYSIHYPRCGFVCERVRMAGKQKTVLVDLNTSQLSHVKTLIQKRDDAMESASTRSDDDDENDSNEDSISATKQIMAHVFESNLENHVSHFRASKEGADPTDFAYSCQVYYTHLSYDIKSSKFVLFLNDRIIDLPPLKRAMEDVYANFSKTKPILVVQVRVPGSQVDVNVHPSKKQVALTYQEDLCDAICEKMSEALQQGGQTFKAKSVAPKIIDNPYRKKRQPSDDQTTVSPSPGSPLSPKSVTAGTKTASTPAPGSNQKVPGVPSLKRKAEPVKKTPPNKFVRTAHANPVGAIEPFVVRTQPSQNDPRMSQSQSHTQPQSQTQSQSQSLMREGDRTDIALSQESQSPSAFSTFKHLDGCPFATTSNNKNYAVDMTQPGAFAQLTCICRSADARKTVMIRKTLVRPKRVVPSKCSYSSIQKLRKRVNKDKDEDLTKQLRDAYFVGSLSDQRSLIQCGEELIMINHLEMGKLLFYQLALARFGEARMARLGGEGSPGISVLTLIGQTLQMKELLSNEDANDETGEELQSSTGLLEVSEMNKKYAQETTLCLLDKAEMLEEYFGIRLVKNCDDAMLTGLPELLEGHIPEPHGLPTFLFRLATEVDWAEERPCFQKICEELGNYYAGVPTEGRENYVQHTLIPAISYLLIPPKSVKTQGYFTVLTKLSTLYKVFERC
ncbi:unnamed protein product [Cylindrotheca closterium]|uniref:DNA mismatch repair protein S5 domain-containing protein n=1 Tax=Cylindrotheca closterium TaxID=2856 RepID=A0AAD2G091_9STRA|nr:unnamed protein product [Cylindrotheca closterium]